MGQKRDDEALMTSRTGNSSGHDVWWLHQFHWLKVNILALFVAPFWFCLAKIFGYQLYVLLVSRYWIKELELLDWMRWQFIHTSHFLFVNYIQHTYIYGMNVHKGTLIGQEPTTLSPVPMSESWKAFTYLSVNLRVGQWVESLSDWN